MSEGVYLKLSLNMVLLELFLLLLCLDESCCSSLNSPKHHASISRRVGYLIPEIPPSVARQPFLPLLVPSPLAPFTNSTVQKLSVCPLTFPNTKLVAKSCENEISNGTACCNAMESYVAHLQKRSLITNLQALDCATILGMKLQKLNITSDVFKLCHVSLKDFTLQAVGNQGRIRYSYYGLLSNFTSRQQESGCLLPSLPSDATFDKSSGISFFCDLNDNIPAPWPSSSQLRTPSCNMSTASIPALPAAASGQSHLKVNQLLASSAILLMLIQMTGRRFCWGTYHIPSRLLVLRLGVVENEIKAPFLLKVMNNDLKINMVSKSKK